MIREIDDMVGKIQMIHEKIDNKTFRIKALKGDLNNVTEGQNKNSIIKEI